MKVMFRCGSCRTLLIYHCGNRRCGWGACVRCRVVWSLTDRGAHIPLRGSSGR